MCTWSLSLSYAPTHTALRLSLPHAPPPLLLSYHYRLIFLAAPHQALLQGNFGASSKQPSSTAISRAELEQLLRFGAYGQLRADDDEVCPESTVGWVHFALARLRQCEMHLANARCSSSNSSSSNSS